MSFYRTLKKRPPLPSYDSSFSKYYVRCVYTSKYTTNIRLIASEKNKNEINTTFVEDIIAVDTIMPGMQTALFTIWFCTYTKCYVGCSKVCMCLHTCIPFCIYSMVMKK